MKQFRALCRLLPLLALLLTGCAYRSADELYALPQQTELYSSLQAALDTVITGEIEYCAPTGGENRQAIQLQDMDGDGKSEAVVFAKAEGDHPLRVYVFSRGADDSFTLYSSIAGDGSGFDSVSYAQVDGSPGMELVVTRSLQGQTLRSLSVYTLEGGLTVELVSTSCTAYRMTDLNSDGRDDLFLLRTVPDTGATVAELYCCSSGGALVREGELQLTGPSVPKRMITGAVQENAPAVLVASEMTDGSYATDVFIMEGGSFRNIASGTELSGITSRSYPAYAADIDGDGLVELPDVRSASETGCQIISWYNLRTDGTREEKLLTWHDYRDGIYLELDPSLRSGLQVMITGVEHGTAYSFADAGGTVQFTLYLFSGDEGTALAEEGRIFLLQKNDICFAALPGSGMTESELRECFHQITTDWNSGEL